MRFSVILFTLLLPLSTLSGTRAGVDDTVELVEGQSNFYFRGILKGRRVVLVQEVVESLKAQGWEVKKLKLRRQRGVVRVVAETRNFHILNLPRDSIDE